MTQEKFRDIPLEPTQPKKAVHGAAYRVFDSPQGFVVKPGRRDIYIALIFLLMSPVIYYSGFNQQTEWGPLNVIAAAGCLLGVFFVLLGYVLFTRFMCCFTVFDQSRNEIIVGRNNNRVIPFRDVVCIQLCWNEMEGDGDISENCELLVCYRQGGGIQRELIVKCDNYREIKRVADSIVEREKFDIYDCVPLSKERHEKKLAAEGRRVPLKVSVARFFAAAAIVAGVFGAFISGCIYFLTGNEIDTSRRFREQGKYVSVEVVSKKTESDSEGDSDHCLYIMPVGAGEKSKPLRVEVSEVVYLAVSSGDNMKGWLLDGQCWLDTGKENTGENQQIAIYYFCGAAMLLIAGIAFCFTRFCRVPPKAA